MFLPLLLAKSCGERIIVDHANVIAQLPVNSAHCLNVHQSWKTGEIPARYSKLVGTWSHKNVRHLLWTDSGNRDLLDLHYPEWAVSYAQLRALPENSGRNVMLSDWARLLYLHKFGGIYADLDYEAHTPPPLWPIVLQTNPEHAVYFVRSPFLITEILQNSLIYAPYPGHSFLRHVCENIDRTLSFIRRPTCYQKNGHSQACKKVQFLFGRSLAQSLVWILKTEQITGPTMLDKTYVQLAVEFNPAVRSVYGLETTAYFASVHNSSLARGQFATHWHANSWVTWNPLKLVPELCAIVTAVLLLGLLLAFYAGKSRCLHLRRTVCKK